MVFILENPNSSLFQNHDLYCYFYLLAISITCQTSLIIQSPFLKHHKSRSPDIQGSANCPTCHVSVLYVPHTSDTSLSLPFIIQGKGIISLVNHPANQSITHLKWELKVNFAWPWRV